MQWHKFVFSEKPAIRLVRHSVFWVAWWMYFSVCQYLYEQPPPGGLVPYYVLFGSHVVIKTFLLVCIYAIACYTFIYILLPQLFNGKWLKAFSGIFCLCAALFTLAYLMFWHIFPFVDALFGTYKPAKFATRFWPAVSLGLIDPLKLLAAAGIIKYIKYWWLKQKESEQLERQNINTELQLLKAQIHPNFLFTALNNLYTYSLVASPRAPEMLLKLSDLLSYMLYECDEPTVSLAKELNMMKDYIALEKIRLNDAVEVEVNIRGDMTDKKIAPFLLLPFIENSFKQNSTLTEHAWMNMDVSNEDDVFSMKLANGILPHSNGVQSFSENDLDNVRKRLFLIYGQRHELKITREPEMLLVFLKIHLAETVPASPAEHEDLITERNKPKLYVSQ